MCLKCIGFGIALSALVLVDPAPARVLEQHFGPMDSCYERVYSKDHMAKHPKQRVSHIRVEHFPNLFGTHGPDGKVRFDEKTGEVAFGIKVHFRGSSEEFSDGGVCYPKKGYLRCQIECDGGGFEIKHRDANSILIYNTRGFAVSGCGGEERAFISTKSDDKVFRLNRLPASKCVPPVLEKD